MKKAKPWLFIVIGSVLLLAAGVLITLSRLDDYFAGQRAQDVLQRLLDDEWEQSDSSQSKIWFAAQVPSSAAIEFSDDELDPYDEDYPDDEQGSGGNRVPLEYSVIGILEIPKLRKKLPVLDRSSSALLNISVCRYSGQVEEKPERLVIAGHNLRSYFGQISTLALGDEILFTTKDGAVFRYSMIGLDICHQSDIDAVQAGADWDITLLTCTKERITRVLVRCGEISE